jgi:photosystem II stability/assembly factor-like uncharacterized protein
MKRYLLQLFFSLCAFVLILIAIGEYAREPLSSSRDESPDREKVEATFALQSMQWYSDQRAYPAGTIPRDWREKAQAHIQQNMLQKSSSTTQLTWTSVGPNNVGGRTRSIAFDPTNSSTMYVGSVSGGIWKTTNAGTSWSVTNDFASNLVIGALAIDPTNANIIYAGTGEGYFNLDALQGVGVLKSTDAGANWSVLNNFSTPNAQFGYNFITKLLIRPDNTSILYAGMLGGIWKTTNAGTSWTKLNVGSSSVRCIDMVMNPTTPDIMYATFGNFSRDGIYKTTNGGTNWSKLSTGLPTAGYNRINIAISKSSPLTLYAVFDDSATHDTYNIYKTIDGGTNWSLAAKPVNPLTSGSHLGGQGWYNNCVVVHPTDPNTVLIGGTNLFKSTNGGASWTMKTNWYTPSAYQFVHADQHVIAYDPSNSSTVYFGNDGGMFKSLDGGETYVAINSSLVTTQFYSGAVQPTGEVYYGGTQDNGTLKSVAIPVWTISLGGDGGSTAVDQTTPANVYTDYVYLSIQKSTNSGGSWARAMSGISSIASPQQFDGTTDRCLFIAPFTMDPSNSQTLVAGTFKAYRTINGAATWTAISSDLTGDGDGSGQVGSNLSAISAIAIAKTSSATIYVGTSGGTATSMVQVTTNTGTLWTNTTKAPLPNRYVKSIAIDPTNASRAFVAFSGYNASTPTTPGHLFLTTNQGTTWANASGNLPDIPVNAVLIDPANVNDIMVGTDIGVFQSVNAGTTWLQQNNGLANVSVADLDYRPDGAVFAATHGRGMYKLATLTGVEQISNNIPTASSLKQNYPNPFNPKTDVVFEIKEQGHASLKIYDMIGREVATLVDEVRSPGVYKTSWDAGAMPSGVYVYRLTSGKYTEARKMMLVK